MSATEEKLAGINRVLDAALGQRIHLHSDRMAGLIGVPEYLAGLRAVRDVENALEPPRRELGAEHSRAFELGRQELQEAGLVEASA